MTSSQPLDLRLPTPGCYNDPERAGLDAKSVFDGMTEHLFFTLGKLAPTASRHDLYMALSYAVRDRLMMRYLATTEAMRAHPQKSVAYLSAEFLIGPQLNNNLLNPGFNRKPKQRFGTSASNPSSRSWMWRKNLDWATVVWDAWRPATWNPSPA